MGILSESDKILKILKVCVKVITSLLFVCVYRKTEFCMETIFPTVRRINKKISGKYFYQTLEIPH